MRLSRRFVAGLLLTALAVAGLVVPASPAAAVDMADAVSRATGYAAARGHQVGITLVDRDTGQSWENDAAHVQMRSASVLKVFVAESLLDRQRRGEISLTQRDRDLMQIMVTQSDDAAMSSLYSRFGGLDMMVSVIGKYGLSEIGGPPTPSYWGMYRITAHDIAAFYQGVLDGGLQPADRDFLVSLMRAATPTGSDGFDQYFGIPRALPYQYWGIKQGWMCCQEGLRRLHTTGILGQDNRFILVVLGQTAQSQSYAALGETLTTVVSTFFPDGAVPPSGRGRGPFGSVDAVVATAPGRFTISGWTADPDAPTSSIDVHVYLDGRLAAYGTAAAARPDVAAALPGYGAAHGYTFGFTALDGVHEVCAYAINIGPGYGNPSLGCRTVDVQVDPVANLEAVQPVGLRGMELVGWAFDPDQPGAPVEIAVTVDGTPVAPVRADRPRPDVGAAFPGAGDAHGFRTTLGMAWPGAHQVCAVARNAAGSPGGDRPLGCRTVVGPSGLLGRLDESAGGTGAITVTGWALDAVRVSDQVPVHVYVDGRFAGVGRADQARPDVGAVFPEAGAPHGYTTTVPAATGAHQVCTFGILEDGRAPNPLLGCGQVTVG